MDAFSFETFETLEMIKTLETLETLPCRRGFRISDHFFFRKSELVQVCLDANEIDISNNSQQRICGEFASLAFITVSLVAPL